MQIAYHRHFVKQYNKLSSKIRRKFDDRLALFTKDPFASELNNRALHGPYLGYRSINVTGDVRALYEIQNNEIITFLIIDTHTNLY